MAVSNEGKPNRGRLSPRLILALFTLGAGLSATAKLSDPDLWWLLAGGKLVLERGIPSANTFSFTWPDYPWRFTQWLFGVVMRLIEFAAGLGGVEAFVIFMVAAAYALTLDTIHRRSGSLHWLPLAPLVVLALSASRFRFVPRPHLATYLGLALLLNLWERRVRRLPLWFGLIAIVWGNCHAGVVFGLALVVAMAVASALARDWTAAGRAVLSSAAFAAGSLLNPNGWYPYRYSFAHLDVYNVLGLYEFRRALPSTETTFFFVAAVALVAVPFRLKRRDFLFPLAAVAFFALAWDSVRIVPKFIMIVLPGLGAASQEFWAGSRKPGVKGLAVRAVTAVFCLAAVGLAVRDYRASSIARPWGWGVDEAMVPEGASRFLLERGVGTRMYNDFGQGGYLAWRLYPQRRVFQDGRAQTYPEEFFREIDACTNGSCWQQLMDKYGVECAVVQRRPFGETRDMSPFFESIGWPMVFLDGISCIFVRPGTRDALNTADAVFRIVRAGGTADELLSKARANSSAVAGELRRIDIARLVGYQDFHRFGAAALVAGEAKLSEAFFRAGLDAYPRDPYLLINLAAALATEGRIGEARMELERAARGAKGMPAEVEASSRLKGLSTRPK